MSPNVIDISDRDFRQMSKKLSSKLYLGQLASLGGYATVAIGNLFLPGVSFYFGLGKLVQ